jgi:hypothetical protein
MFELKVDRNRQHYSIPEVIKWPVALGISAFRNHEGRLCVRVSGTVRCGLTQVRVETTAEIVDFIVGVGVRDQTVQNCTDRISCEGL